MKKKQVGALLKVMGKDAYREALNGAYIDEYNGATVLVATDGFHLVAVELQDGEAEEHQGKFIRRAAVERWYKLATGKDRLNAATIGDVIADDYREDGKYEGADYPNWKPMVDITPGETDGISFNPEYFKHIKDVADMPKLDITFSGRLGGMKVEAKDAGVTGVVMPMKS